jgi:hypothetical protein
MSNNDDMPLYMSENECDNNNNTWPFNAPWMDTGREQSHFPYTANDGVQVYVTDKYDCKYMESMWTMK